MSIQHMSDVWNLDFKMREKIVALAIADCANDSGIAWPGYDYLVKKTGMARATLSKAIKNLVSAGWCKIENHSEFGKGKKVNVYIIEPAPKVQDVNYRYDFQKVQSTKSSNVELPKVQNIPPKSSTVEHEPSLEPPIKENPHSFSQSDSFLEFWSKYPRKVNKGAAERWWMKNVKDQAKNEEIIAGLEKQIPGLAKMEKQFTPHPSTWLNGSRWEDEIEEDENLNNSEWE